MHGCQAFRESLVIKSLDVDLQEVRNRQEAMLEAIHLLIFAEVH